MIRGLQRVVRKRTCRRKASISRHLWRTASSSLGKSMDMVTDSLATKQREIDQSVVHLVHAILRSRQRCGSDGFIFLFWISSYSPYETARLGIGQRTEDLESIGSPPATREVVDGGAGLRKRQLAMVGESKRESGGDMCPASDSLSTAHGMEGSSDLRALKAPWIGCQD